jgi:Signal transduction histidine kinase
MNNKFSNSKKVIAVIIEYFCAISFIAGISIIVSYLNVSNRTWDSVSYIESDAFTQEMLQEVSILANEYIPLREKYEKIDRTKEVIDIERYVTGSSVLSANSLGLTYTLSDLENWAEIGITYEDIEFIREDFESIDADIEEMGVLETSVVAEHYYDYIEGIREEYAPIGYHNIQDYLKKNPQVDSYEAYNYLIQTIEGIGNEKSLYERYTVMYNSSNINLEYVVQNLRTGDIWSNTTSNEADIKKLDAYLEINTSSYVIESNFTKNRSELVNYAWGYYGLGEYMVTIGLNSDLPIQDRFHHNKISYERWFPWRNVGVVLACAGALVGLLSVIYITCAAGRNGKSKEIQLNWFDKIKTEIFIAGSGVIGIGVLILIWEMRYYYWNSYDILTMGILTMMMNTIIIISYPSFVKRIKAKTLWKNSIFYAIISWLNEGITLGRVTLQILLKFGGYFITNMFLIVAMEEFGMFLAFVFNVYVLYVLLNNAIGRRKILTGVQRIAAGNVNEKMNTAELKGENLLLAEEINNISVGLQQAIEKSVKDEKLKTDLITNVSHDIKTPLTSIINYVDLIKRANIEDTKIKSYIEVLDNKSQRLKILTEDLVEASKISSGNIEIILAKINFKELLQQTNGEFDNKFCEKKLEIVAHIPEYPVIINADGRRIWRILENLYNNVHKYAMEHTRVYISLMISGSNMILTIKNISKYPLNINANELTERFIRGDVSRSTEGSGLGLAIADNLTTLQGGTFDIYLDGDLFKVTVTFPIVYEQ